MTQFFRLLPFVVLTWAIPQRPGRVLIALAAAIAGLGLGAAPARSAGDCPDLPADVRITGASAADRRAACAGAGRAIAFLGDQGFAVDAPLTIEVIDRVDTMLGTPVLGAFDPRNRLIRIAASSALIGGDRRGRMFEIAMEPDLYVSIYAHEVAHAILHANTTGQRLSHAAHEYVAYTVQLATMAPDLRRRILAAFPGKGFTTEAEINDVVLAFDPNRFAVHAYRHLKASEDPAAALRQVLERVGQTGWSGS